MVIVLLALKRARYDFSPIEGVLVTIAIFGKHLVRKLDTGCQLWCS